MEWRALRRDSQPLEHARRPATTAIFVWECRIFIQARGLTFASIDIKLVHAGSFNGRDTS
jgi:hypothetical protein